MLQLLKLALAGDKIINVLYILLNCV